MHQFDLMNLILTLASPGPGIQLDRVALVPTRGSHDTGDCGPTWASPGRGDWFPQGPHLDLVTQVLIWASWDLVSQFHIGTSPGPSDSRPIMVLTLTG